MIQYNTTSNIMKGIKIAKGLFSKVFTVVKVLTFWPTDYRDNERKAF